MGIIGDIGGIAQAGASVFSTIYGAKSANEQLEKQFQQQRQLIQEQNEYNSYANQRKLMEEAGLNPALMYQNGTSGALQSEVANAPKMIGQGEMVSSGIDKGISTLMSMAQLKLLESQARKNNADAEGQEIKNPYTREQVEQELQQGRVSIELTKTSIDKLLSDISMANANVAESASRIRLNAASVDKILSEIPNNVKQGIILDLQQQGIKYNNDLIAAKYVAQVQENSLISLRKALMSAQIQSTEASTAKTKADTDFVNLDVLEKDWRYDYIQRTGHTPEAGVWQSLVGALSNMFEDSFGNAIDSLLPQSPQSDGSAVGDSLYLARPAWKGSPLDWFVGRPAARERQRVREATKNK